MLLYNNHIPSSSIIKKAVGNTLLETIASKVAIVIIHEAAHKKSWAEKFALKNQSLSNFDRNLEEQYAEGYEQKAETRLNTQLDPNLLWDKNTNLLGISPPIVLNRAIQIANSLGVLPFQINASSVENRDLSGKNAFGLFEMVQSPNMNEYSGVPMAWDDQSKKLLVDVNSIMRYYAENLDNIKTDYEENMAEINNMQNQNKNISLTRQNDGIEPDLKGVSQDSPLNVVPTNKSTVPSVGAIPAVPAR